MSACYCCASSDCVAMRAGVADLNHLKDITKRQTGSFSFTF